MPDIFFTSDTHFGHTNILTFKNFDGTLVRPEFSSVEEMDEIMIERWNEVVKPNSMVYHLGDVFFRSKEHGHSVLRRLNGKKHLFLGNHDRHMPVFLEHFDHVESWKKTKLYGKKLILSHVPSHEGSVFDGYLNVHGHIHANLTGNAELYVNVCVEHTGYRPVNLDEIEELRRAQAKMGKIKGHRNQ